MRNDKNQIEVKKKISSSAMKVTEQLRHIEVCLNRNLLQENRVMLNDYEKYEITQSK